LGVKAAGRAIILIHERPAPTQAKLQSVDFTEELQFAKSTWDG
jgi:hypothetical protein